MTLPFENDTGRIEKKLARRSLAAERRRNMVAMFTIGLAVCLMALSAFLFTAGDVRMNEQLRGQYQSGCVGISYADMERLTASGKLEQWGYQSDVHSIRYRDTNLLVQFYDAGMRDLMQIAEITGAYPEKKDEICLERAFLKYLHLPEETGQYVCLNLGDGEQTYVVSGILEKENDSRMFDVYISEELAVAQGGEKPFTFRFRFAQSDKNYPEKLQTDIRAFYQELGIAEKDTFYSSNYFELNDIYLQSDLSVYGFALFIAVVCSVVVYNIFYISVMGKLREYGRLKVIGTTPRQLRQIVKRERRMLMWISIPIGLLAAALLTMLLYPGYWDWAKNINYTIFIVIVTVGMVGIATRKPLRMAGQVSAIEAVRSNAYQALSGVSRSLHRPLSVFRLACMNFTRSRKKTVLTLVSLGLTGILTACIASYASSVNVEELARNAFGDGGDYIVSTEETFDELAAVQRDGLLNAAVREQMLALPDVDFLTTYASMYCTVPQCPRTDELFLIGGYTKEQLADCEKDNIVKEGTADYEALRVNNGILVTRDSENLLKKLYHFDVSVGDTITLKGLESVSKDYTVMGIVDYKKGSGSIKFFILPETELQLFYPNISDFTAYINVHTARAYDEQRQALYTLLDDPRAELSSLADFLDFVEKNLRQTYVMLYGVAAFIALFALINLVNTMMTNLLTRRREFGILQSVGMTSRQLSQMISAECFCYVGVTVLITFTVGSACGIGVVRIFNQLGLFGTLTYHFPLGVLLIFSAALFVAYGVFSLAAVRVLQKQSLVERIKEEE